MNKKIKIVSHEKHIVVLLIITFAFTILSLTGCAHQEVRTPVSLLELRKAGMVRQAHEYTCGAASLATLMQILGSPKSEIEVLNSIFGAELPRFKDKDGEWKLRALTMANLETGARKAGFKVVSIKVPEASDAPTAIAKLKPAITRMHLHQEYLHFVVIRDLQDGWVSIADPAYGNIKIPWQQFAHAWEQGDRVLLTISKEAFAAWKEKDDASLSLKRQDGMELIRQEGVMPDELEVAAQKLLRQYAILQR